MEDNLVVLLNPVQDKYDRLYEAHEKLQHLNEILEDKLLKLAENHHSTTTQMTTQIQNLTERLVEARLYISQLEDENERYRNDINIVIQLLQCKPSNFVPSKIESLPEDLQRKVLGLRSTNPEGTIGFKKKSERKIIKVQVPTYSMKTDIMYAVDNKDKNKGPNKSNHGSSNKDRIISAAIMAKVLEEREKERDENSKSRCACASRIILPTIDRETQTLPTCTISCVDLVTQEPLIDPGSSSASSSSYSSTSSSLSSSHTQSPTCSWTYRHSGQQRPDSLTFRPLPLTRRPMSVASCGGIGDGSGSHWSTTVLVQQAPRDYNRSLSLSSPKDNESDHGSFSLGCEVGGPNVRNVGDLGDGGYSDENSVTANGNGIMNNDLQYYRSQKRSFWTRSSSTTSTETEI